MSQVSGYIVKLTPDRSFSFQGIFDNRFAEPVPEFVHSRNVPLVCFIITEYDSITHIGLGKRGFRAGTDLRRLNIDDIIKLKNPLSANEIVNCISAKIRHHLVRKIENGGLFANKCFDEFLSVFLSKSKESIPILSKYSKDRWRRIEQRTVQTKRSLAEQKEAVLTAMNIAGIDRHEAQGWDYNEGEKPKSFLDGIKEVRLREDSMIINDLENIPGFKLIKTTKYSSSVFENKNTRLTVLLANRLPLEELLGTDLIYYNEDHKCFVMVQYKVMEKENEKFAFRVPNNQLSEEIERMDLIISSLQTLNSNNKIEDFRISTEPFFIKFCTRIDFDPDNIGLSSGIYIPLKYLKLLQSDKTISGPRGGKVISFENVGRYFDNTNFKTIIAGVWIETNQNQSNILENIIKDILANGKTAVVAIKKKILSQERIIFDDFEIND